MSRAARDLPRLLRLASIALGLLLVHDWAYYTTYRLYINRRADDASRSTAAQRFEIEGARVVPQIAMRGDDRVAFTNALGRPSTLHVEMRPTGPALYEILWRDRAGDRRLASGDLAAAADITCPIPASAGVVELVSHGRLTWVDPRLVRDLHTGWKICLLAVLVLMSLAARPASTRPAVASTRVGWFRGVAMASSVVVSLVSLEAGLRALGDRVPLGIAAQRHDLGEVRLDPRWEDSRRYGRRLRPHVAVVNEWRYGDIVRMGFIPPELSGDVLHRFRFETDDEGFRNARTPERIDVAALGDSFTDAMTLDAADAWTSRVARRTGLAVQNYGTAGFGPQQELLALKEYALRHRPRLVVLAYFAGNDLFDAEAFEEFERSGGLVRRPVPGWQIKDIVSRADTWFITSAIRAAATWAARHEGAEARSIAPAVEPFPLRIAPAVATFDRGMFTLGVNGRTLRWAFMPPYLKTLNLSKGELAARRGWALTRQAIGDMRDASRAAGAEFVLMFLPFKSQVYLPLLQRSMAASDIARAFQFYMPEEAGTPDVAEMSRNRLAQNVLLREYCAGAGIRFLDTTDVLQARVALGENVYFPDESHLNEAGHAVVADALIALLGR